MKSLQRRFDKISNQNPMWSSYICFTQAIAKQNFAKKTIYFWFSRLVEKSDYGRKEKLEILQELTNSKPP